jgi:hypothetical protein
VHRSTGRPRWGHPVRDGTWSRWHG